MQLSLGLDVERVRGGAEEPAVIVEKGKKKRGWGANEKEKKIQWGA